MVCIGCPGPALIHHCSGGADPVEKIPSLNLLSAGGMEASNRDLSESRKSPALPEEEGGCKGSEK